jgi:hypothetical protein
MVLIELCKDLLDRVETYDISILAPEQLDGHLEKGWSLEKKPLKEHTKSTFGTFSSFLLSFGHHVYSICELAGITTHYEEIVKTIAVGFWQAHPTVCISGVIGLWFSKFVGKKYTSKAAREEL